MSTDTQNNYGNKSPPNLASIATLGTCCAAGVYGAGCLKCTGCVVGSVGCAVGTSACYNCMQKQKQKMLEKTQSQDPMYDPHGPSIVIDKPKLNFGKNTPDRVDKKYIIDYIKERIAYSIDDNTILNKFQDVVPLLNYNETYNTFVRADKNDIDEKIGELNMKYKKNVGGKYTRRKPRKTNKSKRNQKRTKKPKRRSIKNKK